MKFYILVVLFVTFTCTVTSKDVRAEMIQMQLEGEISYISGLDQNLYFGAAVSGLLAENDSVTMMFEFDPEAGIEAAAFNDTKIYKGAIGDWSINFNEGALVIDSDPSITSQTQNHTWVNTSGQSYFNTWDYDSSVTSGAIQAPEFESVAPYDSNWVPWQMLLFFASPNTNEEIPLTPDFTHMRFDYVAHRPSDSNPAGTNQQSGISVSWDSYSVIDPAPVPEPATFILLGGGLAGLAFYRRKRK